jgi:hypothetical protein
MEEGLFLYGFKIGGQTVVYLCGTDGNKKALGHGKKLFDALADLWDKLKEKEKETHGTT